MKKIIFITFCLFISNIGQSQKAAKRDTSVLLHYLEIREINPDAFTGNYQVYTGTFVSSLRYFIALSIQLDSIYLETNRPNKFSKIILCKGSHRIDNNMLANMYPFKILDTIMEKEVWVMKKIGKPKMKVVPIEDYTGGGIGAPEGNNERCDQCSIEQIKMEIEQHGGHFVVIDGIPEETYFDGFSFPSRAFFKDYDTVNQWFIENLGLALTKEKRPVKLKFIKFLGRF